jgi:hypothetical protein
MATISMAPPGRYIGVTPVQMNYLSRAITQGELCHDKNDANFNENISPIGDIWAYRINTKSDACPTGFSQEGTVKRVWSE